MVERLISDALQFVDGGTGKLVSLNAESFWSDHLGSTMLVFLRTMLKDIEGTWGFETTSPHRFCCLTWHLGLEYVPHLQEASQCIPEEIIN